MNENAINLGAHLLRLYGPRGLKGPLFPDAEKWAEEDERRHAEQQLRRQLYARQEDITFAEDVIEAAKNDELREILVVALGMPYLDIVARDVLATLPDAEWDHSRRMIRIGDRRIVFKTDESFFGTTRGRSYDEILFHPFVSWRTYMALAPCRQPTTSSIPLS